MVAYAIRGDAPVLFDPAVGEGAFLESYGGGAIKVEPRNLERLAIPEALASRLAAGPPAGASRLPLR